ncbi:hypothetical protein KSC_065150 [Ktedonobacter sp. SOSP1-52]|uniref:M24 family metallopeptidase n=1 Tax=Ktedonobacter sp. SOSP1-52 TaxID=2778366 RepID=UPI001915EB31|nr:M24 family metallopeptidase [Ktedonobacter sp. SOSP1-52]GHO67623.1 hypothetical protein KSC_065150 [Ktedonobacter sp. SOSP1-52]
MTDVTLQREKINQAIQILDELQLDCWLTFVRETGEQPDPALKLIFDQELTWHCAFILTRTGEKIAIVARYDDDLVKQGNLYDTVITYTDSFASVLVETLTRLNPSSIALNYSIDDVAADGLTHGMYLQLVEALKATPFPERFTSSSPLISRLRSRKTSQELVRMRQAIQETYGLFDLITRSLKAGVTEREISDLVHAEMASRSLGSAWSYDSCPGVKFGPNTLFGHGNTWKNRNRARIRG